MSEPTVSYPVREVLARIESKIDNLERRVAALEATAASAGTVRRAVWAAATSPLVAVGVTYWIARK